NVTGVQTCALPILHCSIRALTSSSCPSCNMETILLPTITPSQYAPRRCACSGVDTPNPASTGTVACFFKDAKYSYTRSLCVARSPVVPVTETTYKKPSDYDVI